MGVYPKCLLPFLKLYVRSHEGPKPDILKVEFDEIFCTFTSIWVAENTVTIRGFYKSKILKGGYYEI